MSRKPLTNRASAFCLIFSVVLILGIIQWSFLPLLIQAPPLPGSTLLRISHNHTSKFAAPFKGLLVDALKPQLPLIKIRGPEVAYRFFFRSEEPIPRPQELYFSSRQLRAPPSA